VSIDHSYTLIKTKLYKPRVSDDLVPRPRLVRRLNQGLNRPLTLAIAPAGYGKTTLMAQWLADCSRPSTWLSLDKTDNNLVLFLDYFIAAIQMIFPESLPETSAFLKTRQLPPHEYLTATLINEISELPELFVLVLDDFHRIEDKTIHQLVEALVDSLLQRMHLVLAGRVEPHLPLARLRVGRQMTEIRTQDLRFTLGEAQAFLTAAVGQSLTDEVITTLEERTEGWIASLRLAALSMRDEADHEAFVQRFRGTHSDLMDYLMAEILSRQSPAVQEFLLRTSILDRFCAPLCEVVTGKTLGESEQLLEEIDRAGLFLIPLDYERNWYRYHHLFQDMLHHRLQAVVSEREIDALHRRAGTWLAGRDLIGEALHHALAAGDLEGAARMVEGCRHDLLDREEWATLERYLNRLPEELVKVRPALILARAWVLDLRYQTARIPPLLRDAEACLSTEEDVWVEPTRGLKGEIDALWSTVLVWDGQGEQALERALRAEERIPITHAYARSAAIVFLTLAYQMTGQARTALLRMDDFLVEASTQPDTFVALLLHAQSYLHLLEGNFHQAAQVLYQLQQLASKPRLTFSMAVAEWALGRINYEWNHLETAKQHFILAFDLRYGSHYMMSADSMVALAVTYQAQGNPDKTKETLDALRRFAMEIGIIERLSELNSVETRLAIFRGDLQSAFRWTETMPLDMLTGYTFVLLELPIVTRARLFIAQGTHASLQEAVRLLQALLARAESTHNSYRQIGILAHLALAFQAQGHTDDALQTLERSVNLAEPGGYIRTFVDLGPEMAKLLYQLAERGIMLEYLSQVLAAFDEPTMVAAREAKGSTVSLREPDSASPVVEPLTRRELEVLKLLDQDLSNKEIAQALIISPLTVKRHVSNIYAKLGTSGRIKAVAKARALSLLPSD
jgi:LuxR family maltose regulon positive regulatory protein